jgi:hypothetical protein
MSKTKNNNFFVEFETPPRQFRNPFNYNIVSDRKFEAVTDETVTVSNCLVKITLYKDGKFNVEPNVRNVDEDKLRKRVS